MGKVSYKTNRKRQFPRRSAELIEDESRKRGIDANTQQK